MNKRESGPYVMRLRPSQSCEGVRAANGLFEGVALGLCAVVLPVR